MLFLVISDIYLKGISNLGQIKAKCQKNITLQTKVINTWSYWTMGDCCLFLGASTDVLDVNVVWGLKICWGNSSTVFPRGTFGTLKFSTSFRHYSKSYKKFWIKTFTKVWAQSSQILQFMHHFQKRKWNEFLQCAIT